MEEKKILIPGDRDFGKGDVEGPGVVLEEGSVRDITDTTLGDSHLPKRQFLDQVAEGQEDWGEGFFVSPDPVIVFRDTEGAVVKTVPLSEVPGVEYTKQDDVEPLEVEGKETPVPLGTADREKLVAILADRLYKYYWNRGPKDPRYNPFRDGTPSLPAGSPEHFQPNPATKLYPCTKAQVYDYCRQVIVERVTLINRNRFGGNTMQDISLRIQ